MSFRDAPPNAPRVTLRIEQDVPCPDCGYNLRGLRMDGRCPECGRPTIDTFARPLRAATGVLAEEMIRRAGNLLVILLAWWVLGLIGGQLPPTLWLILFTLASAVGGTGLLLNLAHAFRLRRQALARRGGSSKPLQEAATKWLGLCLLAVLAWAGLVIILIIVPQQASAVVQGGLILLASASAAGAQLLAAQASSTVLRRLALATSPTAVITLGLAAAALIPACIAPAVEGGLVASIRVLVGLSALLVWMLAGYQVIGRLREAQGSVVSIGKRSGR